MTPLALSVVALILATLAAVGFVALLAWTILDRGPVPEPPEWVNDGNVRRACDRPTRRGHWREDCRS